MDILNPPDWPRPSGYSWGVCGTGRMVFVSGMIGTDAHGHMVSAELVPQIEQALKQTVAVLAQAQAKPEHIARMTWYVRNRGEYLSARPEIGQVYRRIIGMHYPAMSVVEVSALLDEGALVEIEVPAVVP